MSKFLRVEDGVRLFGMSGLQMQDELAKLERAFGFTIRSGNEISAKQHDTEYYPQFDQQVRTEAASMAQHYEVFYCLERSIRQQVRTRMKDSKGAAWWDTSVPQGAKDEVKKNQDRERDSGFTMRSDDPLDYTTFGQLGDIINANWDVFADTLGSQRAVSKVMAQLNTLRGPIAHCCPLAEDEIARLRLSVRDWFRLNEE